MIRTALGSAPTGPEGLTVRARFETLNTPALVACQAALGARARLAPMGPATASEGLRRTGADAGVSLPRRTGKFGDR